MKYGILNNRYQIWDKEMMKLINLEVREVEFNGDTLMAMQDKETEKVYVGASWICNGIGLTEKQRDRQVANIQKDIVLARGAKNLPLEYGGQVRNVIAIELDYIHKLLKKHDKIS